MRRPTARYVLHIYVDHKLYVSYAILFTYVHTLLITYKLLISGNTLRQCLAYPKLISKLGLSL